MPAANMIDLSSRSGPSVNKKRGWKTKEQMAKVGGEKGKLHKELGVPTDKTIPGMKLEAATHSKDPEIRKDAIRAKTMAGWKHGQSEPEKKRKATLYDSQEAKKRREAEDD